MRFVAILQREPDASRWIGVFDKTSKALVLVGSSDPDGITSLLDAFGIDVVSVMPKQGEAAVAAFLQRALTALALIWLIVSHMLSRRCSEHPFFYRANDFAMIVVPAWLSQ